MDVGSSDPIIKPLLLIGGQSSRIVTRKELLQFPDGLRSFEHALETLHSAVPTAPTIYISLHDETQLQAIQYKIDQASSAGAEFKVEDHGHVSNPELKPIFDAQEKDIGPAAGLLAAYSLFPDAIWMVLGCNYPLLPPTALQQLILEYEAPITCFLNDNDFAEPLIALW
jgi:molybdopterin-guanine dinucleotide biosynthesis protein A